MAALTSDRNTPRRDGVQFSFEAGAEIFAGAMVALDATGKAVPAMAAGTVCVGVAQNYTTAGDQVGVRRGVFAFADAADDAALTRADIGTTCHVADDQTVKKAAGAVAGIIVDVDADGIWIKI